MHRRRLDARLPPRPAFRHAEMSMPHAHATQYEHELETLEDAMLILAGDEYHDFLQRRGHTVARGRR